MSTVCGRCGMDPCICGPGSIARHTRSQDRKDAATAQQPRPAGPPAAPAVSLAASAQPQDRERKKPAPKQASASKKERRKKGKKEKRGPQSQQPQAPQRPPQQRGPQNPAASSNNSQHAQQRGKQGKGQGQQRGSQSQAAQASNQAGQQRGSQSQAAQAAQRGPAAPNRPAQRPDQSGQAARPATQPAQPAPPSQSNDLRADLRARARQLRQAARRDRGSDFGELATLMRQVIARLDGSSKKSSKKAVISDSDSDSEKDSDGGVALMKSRKDLPFDDELVADGIGNYCYVRVQKIPRIAPTPTVKLYRENPFLWVILALSQQDRTLLTGLNVKGPSVLAFEAEINAAFESSSKNLREQYVRAYIDIAFFSWEYKHVSCNEPQFREITWMLENKAKSALALLEALQGKNRKK